MAAARGKQLKSGYHHKEHQKELKAQYGLEEEVVVIEKKSAVAQSLKVIFTFCMSVLRIIATILLVALAVVGLLSILYPNIREELIFTIRTIWNELMQMTGGRM